MLPDPIRQRLQPQTVGNITAAFADHTGDIVLAVAEIADQRAIAFGFFERIEVRALHILDDRELQRFFVSRFDDDDRDFMQTGTLRRAPAAFAGDDLVSVGGTTHRTCEDRLNDASLTQRGDKLVELGVGEHAPRIARIGPQRSCRHPPLAARPLDRRFGVDFANQCGQSAS